MQVLAVMEALDILRDGIAGLGLILKLPMPDQLIHFFWLVGSLAAPWSEGGFRAVYLVHLVYFVL